MNSAGVLDPAGPVAAASSDVAWWMFIGGGLIFLLVIALTLAAWRAHGPVRPRVWIVGAGVIFPAAVLIALLVASTLRTGGLDAAPAREQLAITVIGHMWWWEVRYRDPLMGHDFASANEVRIPVGRPVTISVTSKDVIHSFWIPALAGKIDMLPDRMEQIRLQADRPGVYRGQCAEYCGTQHARMVLHVVAMPEPEFEAWLRNEAQPQARSADPRLEQGRQIFLELRCAACHTVRGVAQSIELGPDLTHLGSRLTLAAGTLPMDERRLAEWIADPQALKPGARMPSYTHVEPQALSLLAAYLEQLR